MASLKKASLLAFASLLVHVASQCPPGSTPKTTKINVYVAPHSHDDVGWDETYLQYFNGNGPIHGRNVSFILEQVVQGLLANPKRRFTYVEQAFFQLWYETQTPALQAQVQGLVKSRQLVFQNGGWSMHDEANPSYVDMLDNTGLGQRNIVNNFGVAGLPTLTWQIDPFGHSAFQGILSGPLSGYQGIFWGREAADFKQITCKVQGVERIWSPSPSRGSDAITFQGVFVDSGYQSPGECGRCDYSKNCNASYAPLDLAILIDDMATFRAPNVRKNIDGSVSLLLNFGDDFTWENAADYFPYLDAIIEGLNSDSSGRYTAFYSTAADYVADKLKSVASFPLVSGDFFPYNDDAQGHNMWSGYFTSRPSFKGFVRESSAYMQSARQLQALVGSVADLSPSNPLFKLERALGVTQHHDSVAGTAQQNVNDDYALQLEGGRVGAYSSIGASFTTATGYTGAPFTLCPLSNVTLCPSLEAGAPTVVLAYNSLAQANPSANVRLSAGFPAGVKSYAVYDATGKPVIAQVVPFSQRDSDLRTLYGGSAGSFAWLAFVAPLPASGFSAFFLVPSASEADAAHTVMSTLTPLVSSDSSVTNGRLTLTVSSETGFLAGYADSSSGVAVNLTQSWLSYIGFSDKASVNGSSQKSGAYIFRPASETALPLLSTPASVVLVTGPIVNEFQSTYGYVTQATRLWAGASNVEVEWTVGPVDVSDGLSHEVITRYDGNMATSGQWATDSNCREAQIRQRNYRPMWPIQPSEAVSANYFPTNCLIRTSSSAVTLAVAVDRSEGSTSLTNGQLEIMVHRRMKFDDGRGVGESLNEPGVDGNGLIIRGRHWIVAAPVASAPVAYKALQQQSLALPTTVTAFAPLGALTPAQWLAANQGSASLLSSPLPPNLHLATIQAMSPTSLLVRLAHLYDAGEDAAGSAPATVALATMLAGRTVTAAVEMTLPGSQPLAGVPQTTYITDAGDKYVLPVLPPPPAGASLSVTLTAQQIRVFLLTVA